MKKTGLIVGMLFSLVIFLRAEPGIITMKKDNKQVKCEILNVDNAGTIEYEVDSVKSKVKAKDYISAKVQPPQNFEKSEKLAQSGKWEEALPGFDETLNSKYKYLGFELPSLYWKAFCMDKIEKEDDAVKILEELQKYELPDKSLENYLDDSNKLLSAIYIKQDKFDQALPILTALGNSNNENIAAFSFNAGGEILKKQNKKREAVLMYMRTVLLFPASNPERKESLKNITALLRELNDNRATKFEEILKKDYPGAE